MINQYQDKIETLLQNQLNKGPEPFQKLYDAMHYSLAAGGKRIRPLLMQLAYEAVGGKEDISAYLCAIEMVHTYSLIHDDLPAMDNDDLRRGKPTNHIKFGEATAILAGDGLLNTAFEMMLEDCMHNQASERIRGAYLLSQASGIHGMIAGQILDMESEDQQISKDTLDLIQLHKTGALIAAATQVGAVLGGGIGVEIDALTLYGKYIGKAFQIIDDILDETSTAEKLGKPVNSDIKNNKNTYLSFYTVEESYAIAKALTEKAVNVLSKVSGDTTLLKQIASSLIQRKN
ncbi:MAG: polyprenyl synthetase family protein [Cellulosilyticaceae bacterium]